MGVLNKYSTSSPDSPCKACNLRLWQTSTADTRDFHLETPSLANHPSLPLVLTSHCVLYISISLAPLHSCTHVDI